MKSFTQFLLTSILLLNGGSLLLAQDNNQVTGYRLQVTGTNQTTNYRQKDRLEEIERQIKDNRKSSLLSENQISRRVGPTTNYELRTANCDNSAESLNCHLMMNPSVGEGTKTIGEALGVGGKKTITAERTAVEEGAGAGRSEVVSAIPSSNGTHSVNSSVECAPTNHQSVSNCAWSKDSLLPSPAEAAAPTASIQPVGRIVTNREMAFRIFVENYLGRPIIKNQQVNEYIEKVKQAYTAHSIGHDSKLSRAAASWIYLAVNWINVAEEAERSLKTHLRIYPCVLHQPNIICNEGYCNNIAPIATYRAESVVADCWGAFEAAHCLTKRATACTAGPRGVDGKTGRVWKDAVRKAKIVFLWKEQSAKASQAGNVEEAYYWAKAADAFTKTQIESLGNSLAEAAKATQVGDRDAIECWTKVTEALAENKCLNNYLGEWEDVKFCVKEAIECTRKMHEAAQAAHEEEAGYWTKAVETLIENRNKPFMEVLDKSKAWAAAAQAVQEGNREAVYCWAKIASILPGSSYGNGYSDSQVQEAIKYRLEMTKAHEAGNKKLAYCWEQATEASLNYVLKKGSANYPTKKSAVADSWKYRAESVLEYQDELLKATQMGCEEAAHYWTQAIEALVENQHQYVGQSLAEAAKASLMDHSEAVYCWAKAAEDAKKWDCGSSYKWFAQQDDDIWKDTVNHYIPSAIAYKEKATQALQEMNQEIPDCWTQSVSILAERRHRKESEAKSWEEAAEAFGISDEERAACWKKAFEAFSGYR